MIRSQIYLTEKERISLKSISENTGRTQSDLIREAVDTLIDKMTQNNNAHNRRKAFGIWKDKDDYPDIKKIRDEFDRTF